MVYLWSQTQPLLLKTTKSNAISKKDDSRMFWKPPAPCSSVKKKIAIIEFVCLANYNDHLCNFVFN